MKFKSFIFLNLSLILFLFPQLCSAEIHIWRDLKGNVTGKYSSNIMKYDENFDIRLIFSGKTTDLYYDKKHYPMPEFSISFIFNAKNPTNSSLTPIHFIDRSFAYKTSEMGNYQISFMEPLRKNTHGYLGYHKLDGQYKVYADDKSVAVFQESIPVYYGPNIDIRYYSKLARNPSTFNPLDKLTSFNDPIFGARVMRSLIFNYGIELIFPYSTDLYKEYDGFTPSEIANLPRLKINIPQDIIKEWQEVAQFELPNENLLK